MSEINRYTLKLLGSENLTSEEVSRAMQIMILGGATPAQSSAFMTALRMKGYMPEEIGGAISFLSSKIKITGYDKPSVFISIDEHNAEEWTACAYILSSMNIPVYLQFIRSDDKAHFGQFLNVDMEMDSDLALECLEEIGLCIAFQKKPVAFRNILPVSEELEFYNVFDISTLCASPVNNLLCILELPKFCNKELIAKAQQFTGCKNSIVLDEKGDGYLASNGIVKEFKMSHFFETHPIQMHEKVSRLNSLLHNLETINQDSILTKVAQILVILNAAPNIEVGKHSAYEALRGNNLYQRLETLIHISNAIEEEEGVGS